ncbi:hypothetical protein [Burkholderia cepacia]|uniref:hypothetical protein n=1 Tax=Burkholderia cepacia TaxID=292 RepID=UPI002AB67258|nr:hypothetical protein [Burkholderia cepacia]
MKRNVVVAWTAGALLTIEEVDFKAPSEADVPIEVRVTDICQIDHSTLNGACPDLVNKGESACSIELY